MDYAGASEDIRIATDKPSRESFGHVKSNVTDLPVQNLGRLVPKDRATADAYIDIIDGILDMAAEIRRKYYRV